MHRSTYTGPPATIADVPRIGVSAVIIECARLYRSDQARNDYDASLPDELPSITKHRRFICTKCGSCKVTAHACWADFSVPGNGVPAAWR